MAKRNTTPILIAGGLAAAAAYYFFYRDNGGSTAGDYRAPHVTAIPIPSKPEDALAFRFVICDLAATNQNWDVNDVLNRVYAGLGLTWPTVTGDHQSMTEAQTYVKNLIAEYWENPEAFCKTGP